MKGKITYQPIGYIVTPYNDPRGMPIQSTFSNTMGKALLAKKYAPATRGLEDFSHIYLIYHFHRAKKPELQLKPFLSNKKLGLFSIRAPNRPNSIGFSIVRLKEIIITEEWVEIHFEGADMLNNTPLLDIKPYFSVFDIVKNSKDGWYVTREFHRRNSDHRFTKKEKRE
jgi:tRNA-Thr(GGU) m(6)t(6)A37 methyltransferase TsaA